MFKRPLDIQILIPRSFVIDLFPDGHSDMQWGVGLGCLSCAQWRGVGDRKST